MSGKKVNITVGITIILLAIYMIILPINIEDGSSFNRYENMVINAIKTAQYVLMGIIIVSSIVFSISNRNESGLRNSYLLVPLIILGFIVPIQFLGGLTLLAGMLVIYFTNKKNYVAIDYYFVFSVFLILVFAILALIGSTFFVKNIAYVVKDEVEKSIGIQHYDKEFFKYITPIENEPAYINLNVKRDGKKKYGYIDNKGRTKIEFDYDYATAFYKIKEYDKEFVVAAVSKDNITDVILKNKRVVMSYISEFETYDYYQRTEEFKNILKDVFEEKEIVTEISRGTTNMSMKKVSPKVRNQEYTYKYNLNNKKDILIFESEVGNPTRFVMKNVTAPFAEMKLETTNLVYDEDYLYTFGNDTIPFYDRDRNEQGWFMADGEKITLTGNAQIMDIAEDKVLIKNHSKNTAYFIDYHSKVISPIFRDVIVDQDRYLIRTMSDKWMITDKTFKKVFNEEFDIVNTSLLSDGIYLLANLPDNLLFNEYNYIELHYMVVTRSGHVILNGVDQVYDIFHKFDGKKNEMDDVNDFKDKLKQIQYINVGDKFYKPEYKLEEED